MAEEKKTTPAPEEQRPEPPAPETPDAPTPPGLELMTMDELTTMPGDKCILQLRGLRPFFSPKYDLKQHPNYRYTAEADKKNAFDLSRLISRRMEKLDPDERYTVYEADVPDEADIGEDEDIFNYDDLDDPDAFV